MAALTATIITYPLDTAKAILSVSSKADYPNLSSVFAKTYQERGFKTFYRGLYPTVLGVHQLNNFLTAH